MAVVVVTKQTYMDIHGIVFFPLSLSLSFCLSHFFNSEVGPLWDQLRAMSHWIQDMFLFVSAFYYYYGSV